MSNRQINCQMGPDQVLVPTSGPYNMVATIAVNKTPEGTTGVVMYGGGPRAYLTFDHTGSQIISVTLTVQDQATSLSIENILRAL